jgi:hypothetical protein
MMSDETCCGACGYPIHATKESACDWCRQSADRIEALTKERNALRSALNRIRPIPERILRGIPVRDLAETLAEADSALIKGESHE